MGVSDGGAEGEVASRRKQLLPFGLHCTPIRPPPYLGGNRQGLRRASAKNSQWNALPLPVCELPKQPPNRAALDYDTRLDFPAAFA